MCDPGWKELYDELMASDALYAEYTKDVWYPPFSGVREKIDRIHKKHPRGFRRQRGSCFMPTKGYSPLRQNLEGGVNMSGNAAFDLAELELDNFAKLQEYKSKKLSKKSSLAEEIRQSEVKESAGSDSDDDSYIDSDDEESTSNHDHSAGSGGSLNAIQILEAAKRDKANDSATSLKTQSLSALNASVMGGSEETRREFRKNALSATRTYVHKGFI